MSLWKNGLRAASVVTALMAATLVAMAAESNTDLIVADMEGATEFRGFPFEQPNSPQVSLTTATASEGQRSLRFEFDADGQTRASLVFPYAHSLSNYDVLVFDFYCERDNGGQLSVNLHPQGDADPENPVTSYAGSFRLSEGRDGWITMRLIKDRTLRVRSHGRPTAWESPRALSFGLGASMKGEVVFYIDNIRFEQASANKSPNLVLNGSFEASINGDSPDAWRRDFDQPPFGRDVWRTDPTTAWHGEKSLRMSAKKTAYAWGRVLNLVEGNDYTFSAYVKGEQEGTRVKLSVNGLEDPYEKEFTVGTEWERIVLTGKAARARTSALIMLLDETPLWVDGAQLEEGSEATPFEVSSSDTVAGATAAEGSATPTSLNDPVRQAQILKIDEVPTLDGNLSEAFWADAEPMTDFVGVESEQPSEYTTVAKVVYNATSMFIGIEAKEPDMDSARALLSMQSKVWGQDSVEVFLDFNGDRRTYHQLIASASGEKWSSSYNLPRKKVAWDVDWKVAGSTQADGWSIEIEVPYSSLNLLTDPPAGENIGMNICRNRKSRTAGEKDNNSSWSFTHGTFHNPRAFGEVVGFDPSVLDPYRWGVEGLSWSRGTAQVSLRNLTHQDEELSVRFSVESDGQMNQTEAITQRISSGEGVDVALPLALPEDGYYHLKVIGEGPDGDLRLLSQSSTVQVSGASLYDLVGPEFDFYTTDTVARVRCFVEAGPEVCRDLRVNWRLDGEAASGSFTPVPGLNMWEIDLTDLPVREYALSTEVVRDNQVAASESATLRKIPAAPEEVDEVRINRWGRFFVVAGEPLFSFGWFDASIARRVSLADWEGVVSEMAENGSTTILTYTGLSTNLAEVLGGYLDVAEKHGQGVWVHLSGMLTWNKPKSARTGNRFYTKEDANEALKEVITKYRSHPALLGWMTYDEPGNRPDLFTAEVALESYRLIKRLDPHHPCFISHLNHMGDSKIYGASTDVALVPFLERGGRYDHLFQEFWEADYPVIINAPCYGAAGGSMREPTIAEQRVRSYKGIIKGARGILYYTFRPSSENLWEGMGEIGAEIQALKNVLLSPNDRLGLDVTPGGEDLLATLRRDGDDYVVIAVNTSPLPVDAVFLATLPSGAEEVIPLFGAPPATVDSSGKRLSVTLDGMSSAVYKLIVEKK